MHILVENSQENITIDDKLSSMFEKALELSLTGENFQTDVELNLYFVNNEEIREINREQRNIDKATDVLSFPMAEILKGKLIGDTIDVECDVNPETGLLILGDIIISSERAIEQAEEYGHSVEREMMFLLTHGIFHILGYDHLNETDEKEMMEKQEKVLSKMGISRG